MTNYEKHREQIDRITRIGRPIAMNKETGEIVCCHDTECAKCMFGTSEQDCGLYAIEWAEAEYEEPAWSDVPIDTPILVRDHSEDNWLKRHFAGVSDLGVVMAWDIGCTSWTNGDTSPVLWKYAKLELEAENCG